MALPRILCQPSPSIQGSASSRPAMRHKTATTRSAATGTAPRPTAWHGLVRSFRSVLSLGTDVVPKLPHVPIHTLSLRDKKSLATAFAHALEPRAFKGSPHDAGMQITHRVPGILSGRRPAATLKKARSPFSQRAIGPQWAQWLVSLMAHRRLSVFACKHLRETDGPHKRSPIP